MKKAEEWAKEEFGFLYIDDVEPQMKTAFGTTGLLRQIRAIQVDALKEAAEIACDWQKYNTRSASIQCLAIHDAILARIRELEADTKNK